MSKVQVQTTLEILPIAGLVPYARNSRTHSDGQVQQIAASMREFGFTNPVLVDEAGGIIAGHGRVMAAKALDLQTVPCIRLSHLSEAQKRAYVIADNKLALNAGWDEAVLRMELQDLQLADFELGLLGFNDEELAGLMADPIEETDGLTDADEAPEPQKIAITKPGDLWLCGNHRLLCGDSTSIDALERLTGGGVDMWLTDPPYNVAYQGKTKDARRSRTTRWGTPTFGSFCETPMWRPTR